MARMPRKRKIDRELDRLERKYRRQFSKAFFEVVRSINNDVRLSNLVDAIKRGDFERVIRLLAIEAAAFRPISRTIAAAYEETGQTVADSIMAAARARRNPSGTRTIFRFDVENTDSQNWLRGESGRLITLIETDTLASVRNRLQEGMIRGDNPRRVALDIVGRVDSTTGRRTGGLVGLNRPQARYVGNAREELASTSKQQLSKYLTRQRRDRRFDHHVMKALREGTEIPRDIQSKMAARYADKLLALRGEMIARTEMIQSLNKAQFDSYSQSMEKGIVKEVRKFWDSAGFDGRTRDSHLDLDGTDVGMKEAFVSPATGASMMYPGDNSMGAHGEDVIMCRCRVRYSVDFMAGLT